ncbi:MAG: LysR family transcriptional regulator [Mycobacteriaceae bacterium]
MIDHRLTVFRTFAACGTVTAAADALGYSPSAVSAQLREYQRALGVHLVTRAGRGLELTAAGAELAARSDELTELWDRIHGSVRRTDPDSEPVLLRLGGFSTATGSLLLPVAARLHGAHPDLDITITEADPERCIDLLTAERLDIAVTVAMQAEPDVDNRRIEQLPLLDDPLDVLLPANHPLAGRASVDLGELAGDPWVADHPGTTYRALFTTAFTAAGATPRVVHEVSDWITTVSIVSGGLGVGLVPRLVRLDPNRDVVRMPLQGPSAPSRRILVMLRRSSRSHRIFEEAVDALQTVAGGFGGGAGGDVGNDVSGGSGNPPDHTAEQ